jgi:hypothetical protein
MNSLLHCLLGKNDRCAKIEFSVHQNAENQHNETLKNLVQNLTIPLKLELGKILRLHVC